MSTTTCQVCARAIKANTGTIAHHGYTRPGTGWQTASCFGAKYRPYEVACDALPRVIAHIENHICMVEERLAAFLANPPAELSHQDRDAWGNNRGALRTFARPENLDVQTPMHYCRTNTYEYHFVTQRCNMERDLRGSRGDLEVLRKRLADWVPPT